MKLCWEAMGGAPGSYVRGPLILTIYKKYEKVSYHKCYIVAVT